MKGPRPPRRLERLLERLLPRGLSGQSTLGDLSEEYARRAGGAPKRAVAWYVVQVASIALHRLLSGREGVHARDSMLLADLRWTGRSMVRHPAFSLAVVAVLGVGLGANAGVFSVVDGTLRRSSAWADPERTVAIWPERGFSFGMIEWYREEAPTYRSIGGWTELAFALRAADGESQSVVGAVMSPELFRELAVQPMLGRGLAPEDALLGVQPVAVVGESLWRRSFGADPSLVGSTIDIGGTQVTVVGIQGPGGRAPGGRAELWLPLVMDPRDDDYFKAQTLAVVGVLADGRSLGDAAVELGAYTGRLSERYPAFYPPGFADGLAHVELADAVRRRQVATPLLLLLAGTGLLLLVTALNVGNLLLGRAIDRRKELAVRSALGAGVGRIVGQLLAEGTALTGLALAVGLFTASLVGPSVAGYFVGEIVVTASPIATPAVLGFAALSTLAAWVILNGVPIAYFLRTRLDGLRAGYSAGSRARAGLVAVQAALATLLLVSATLFVATVDNLRKVPLGFDPEGLVAVELSPPEDRVRTTPLARDLYGRLVERAAAVPGVEAVGLTGWVPLRAEAPTTPINLRSAPVDPAQAVYAPMNMVDPGFFAALGVRAEEGRLLSSEDRGFQPSAVVVNRSLADVLWPDGNAVGQLVAIDPHAWNRWVPVVGVVPDIRSSGVTGPPGPALYVSLAESPARDVALVVRSARRPSELGPELRLAVSEADPLVPVRRIDAMGEVVRSAYAVSWVLMGLLSTLAVLATGLGALGIYAVLAHQVVARRRDLGVRKALGARPTQLVGSVVRSGLLLAAVGIVAGSAAAAVLARLVESQLFGVSTLAPVAYVAPALALAAAAGLAAWVPAMRASRLPPAEVLRSE